MYGVTYAFINSEDEEKQFLDYVLRGISYPKDKSFRLADNHPCFSDYISSRMTFLGVNHNSIAYYKLRISGKENANTLIDWINKRSASRFKLSIVSMEKDKFRRVCYHTDIRKNPEYEVNRNKYVPLYIYDYQFVDYDPDDRRPLNGGYIDIPDPLTEEEFVRSLKRFGTSYKEFIEKTNSVIPMDETYSLIVKLDFKNKVSSTVKAFFEYMMFTIVRTLDINEAYFIHLKRGKDFIDEIVRISNLDIGHSIFDKVNWHYPHTTISKDLTKEMLEGCLNLKHFAKVIKNMPSNAFIRQTYLIYQTYLESTKKETETK